MSQPSPPIVDAAQWKDARLQLLEAEKAASKARAALAAQRAAMPWTAVDDYKLQLASTGEVTPLSTLFRSDDDELLVYHLMWSGEGDSKPCSLCSFFIDQYQGALPHLNPRARLVVVAKAPAAKLAEIASVKGWTMPMLSAADTSFCEDMGVHFTAEQRAQGPAACVYNFNRTWQYGPNAPGVTVFRCRSSGEPAQRQVYKTYATFAAGLADVSTVHSLLDLTSTGRGEQGKGNMWWVKQKEDY